MVYPMYLSGTNPMEYANNITVSEDLIKIVVVVLAIVCIYFFSTQLQRVLSTLFLKLGQKVGTYSTTREYHLQRYVYQHKSSPISWLYRWVNEQLIALGYKRLGITVVGYLIFWGFIALLIALVIEFITKLGAIMFPVLVLLCFICSLIMTRVAVSERMERREADVMNAIDLIVPEVGNGIKNAIVTYKDNFAPSVRDDFQIFVSNIQERGYSFEDAMYILADNLGIVFQDFAQKAIYYEAIGEKEMMDIFTDLTETNRLRRQLRDENNSAFVGLKSSFIVSTVMTFGYFIFIVLTDEFSRNFFLIEPVGKVLLVIIVLIVFMVLAYISTIKSRAI